MVALVAALVTQGFLVYPEVVLVGGEQVDVVVQLLGVRHVIGDKVVKAADRAGEHFLVDLARQLHQTLYGPDVVFSFRDAKVAPVDRVSFQQISRP